MKGPVLKGKRITLQPIALANASIFVQWFKDPEIVQYMLPAIYKISLEKEKQYIRKIMRNKRDIIYVILVDKKIIGSVGVHLDKKLVGNAGFGIVIGDKNCWGKGYAGECINLLGDFVFKKLKMDCWHLTVFKENKKAIRAYKKAGFITETLLKKNMKSRVDGKFHDEYAMCIFRSEWLKSHKSIKK